MARIVFAIFLLGPPAIRAQILALPSDDFAWVNLRAIAPAIRIELRYATSENIAHRAHTLVSFAKNNGALRLLWIAHRMVAFHNQRLETLRSGTACET